MLNKRLEEAARTIIANSDMPPAIIIQGDQGWAMRNNEDKLSILNACYLPHGDLIDPYPFITPINFYGLIFDQYREASSVSSRT